MDMFDMKRVTSAVSDVLFGGVAVDPHRHGVGHRAVPRLVQLRLAPADAAVSADGHDDRDDDDEEDGAGRGRDDHHPVMMTARGRVEVERG